jgi:hypothetical protein
LQYLGEIEEHLGITINRIGPEMEVPMDEYDGKVVYGTKKAKEGSEWRKIWIEINLIILGGPNLGHAVEMTGIVGVLSHLEREVQWAYLELMNGVKWMWPIINYYFTYFVNFCSKWLNIFLSKIITF